MIARVCAVRAFSFLISFIESATAAKRRAKRNVSEGVRFHFRKTRLLSSRMISSFYSRSHPRDGLKGDKRIPFTFSSLSLKRDIFITRRPRGNFVTYLALHLRYYPF